MTLGGDGISVGKYLVYIQNIDDTDIKPTLQFIVCNHVNNMTKC